MRWAASAADVKVYGGVFGGGLQVTCPEDGMVILIPTSQNVGVCGTCQRLYRVTVVVEVAGPPKEPRACAYPKQ